MIESVIMLRLWMSRLRQHLLVTTLQKLKHRLELRTNRSSMTGFHLAPPYPQYSSWLTYDDEKQHVFCSLCTKQKKDNALAQGTDNFRTSTLQQHLDSADHRNAVQELAFLKDFQTACEKSLSGKDEGVKMLMMAAYWFVKEEMPVSKFSRLIMLLKLSKCPDIESMYVGENATYMSDTAANEMIDCIAEVVKKEAMDKVQSSPTDLTVDKKLVFYARVLNPQTFQPSTVFLTNIHIDDGTAKKISKELVSYLSSKGISMEKMSGFGSDGASVMTGKKGGVAALLRDDNPSLLNIHCTAHRLALCTSQESNSVQYLKEYQDIVTSLFYYFKQSAGCVQKIKEIQTLLEDPELRYTCTEVHEVR